MVSGLFHGISETFEGFQWYPEMFPGCYRGFKGVPVVFEGLFRAISMAFHGLRGITRSVKDFPGVFLSV